MTNFIRENGVYSSGSLAEIPARPPRRPYNPRLHPTADQVRRVPGVCLPWQEKRKTIPQIEGVDGDQVMPACLGRPRQPGLHVHLADLTFFLRSSEV